MNNTTVTSAVEGFSAALNGMPLKLRKSMTYDQGKEMAKHAEITQCTGVRIYFLIHTARGSGEAMRISMA
ncbi:hypothetical protein SAMN02745127_01648 [Oceanospirillum multiglobuliferum]|nr:hypothetical protein SAMN02745127_01648 [Oceanospirillum multiglobuliferum]